jgi:hypothetical protein
MAEAHMELQGAMINELRSVVTSSGYVETCDLCHGSGRLADVNLVHE